MADGRGQGALAFQPADALLSGLRAAQPQPWSTRLPDDPGAALADAPEGSLSTLWIADGTDHPNRAGNEQVALCLLPALRQAVSRATAD